MLHYYSLLSRTLDILWNLSIFQDTGGTFQFHKGPLTYYEYHYLLLKSDDSTLTEKCFLIGPTTHQPRRVSMRRVHCTDMVWHSKVWLDEDSLIQLVYQHCDEWIGRSDYQFHWDKAIYYFFTTNIKFSLLYILTNCHFKLL